MRIIFSILLFSIIIVRPAIEVSTVLYYQLNIDYIVEKYCVNKERPKLNCNGKCYLMSQIETDKEPVSKTSGIVISAEAFIPLFFQEYAFQIQDIYTNFNTIHNWKFCNLRLLEISKDIDYPPEQVSS